MSNHVNLNFEAYVRDAGDRYEVQLFMNHYLVHRWPVEATEYWTFVNDQAHLNQFVAGKFFNLFKEKS